MAPQVTVNFNKLLITFVIKRGMFEARKNVHVVFTVGPRSILAEFPFMPNRRGTYRREAPTARATVQPRHARAPHRTPKQVRLPTSAPRKAQVTNLPQRRGPVPSSGSIHICAPTSTGKGAKTSKKPLTSRIANKPFGEGTSGVKKAQASPTRWILIGTIRIDIPVAEVMMTPYSDVEIIPKTAKVEFVKPSTSSTSTMVPRLLQVTTTTPPQSPTKGRRILPPRPQKQSDLTFEGIKSQAYNGSITRSRAKALSYAEVAL